MTLNMTVVPFDIPIHEDKWIVKSIIHDKIKDTDESSWRREPRGEVCDKKCYKHSNTLLEMKPSRWPSGYSVCLECGRLWFASQLSHTSVLKTGIRMATVPDTWCHRVGARTDPHCASILTDIAHLIYIYCNVAARQIVQIR